MAATSTMWLLSSCGLGDGSEREATDDPAATVEPFIELKPAELAFARSVPVSASVERILADGKVTFSEYEGAFLSMLQCFKDNGVSLKMDPVLDVQMHYSYILTYSPSVAAQVREQATKCSAEHFEPVSRAWASFKPADFDAKMAAARRWMASCMQDRGVDIEDEPSAAEMTQFLIEEDVSYVQCLFLAKTEFNLGPLAP